jgi:hypothetical protein
VLAIAMALLIWVLSPTIGFSREPIQDWLPDGLDFPDDTEVIHSREIGSTIRMFSIVTAEDPDEILSRWRDYLDENGYIISETGVGALERAIEFSGQGISSAQIIISPSSADGRSIIEFDATLN